MRIKSLRVDNFGHFSDFSLELKPGLNLFYGSNEAGKSTLLAFLRAILFGFEKRNHLARYEPARGTLGGELSLEASFGSVIVRRQGGKRVEGELSVRGDDGAQLPTSRLSDALGGISRELFYEVFAFGLDELASFERLASQGTVSEALFAAGMQGAHRLPAAVEALRKSSEGLFKPGGHKPPLNAALEELEAVRSRLRELGDRPQQHSIMRDRLSALEQQFANAEKEASELRQEHEAHARLCGALPDLQAVDRLDQELLELGDLSSFPEAGIVRLEELGQRLSGARKDRQALAAELASVEREVSLLARAARGELPEEAIRAALEAFGARASEHRALPARAAGLAERERQLMAEAKALGLARQGPELVELELGAAARAQLVGLAERHVELERTIAAREEALRSAKTSRQQAEDEVARLSLELSRLPSTPASSLRGALAALGRVEPARREKERLSVEGQERRAAAAAISSTVDPMPKEIFPGWGLWAIAAVLALGVAGAFLTGGLKVAVSVGLAAVGLLALAVFVQRRAAASLAEQRSACSTREQGRSEELARLRTELAELANREQAVLAELAQLYEAAKVEGSISSEALREKEISLREELAGVEKRARLQEEMEGHSARMAAAQRVERDAKADRDLVEASQSKVDRELAELLGARGFPSGLTPTAALELWSAAAALRQRVLDLTAEKRALSADEGTLGKLAQAVMEAAVEAGLETHGLTVDAAAAALEKLLEKGEEARNKSRELEVRRADLAEQLTIRERAVVELEEALGGLLRQGGCEDPEAFRTQAAKAERFREARAARRELASRIDAAVGLEITAAHQKVSAAGGSAAVKERLQALSAKLEEAAKALRALSEERGELRLKLKALEEDQEAAQLRAREESLSAKALELAQEYARDRIALGLLSRARARFEQEQQPKVIKLASSIFSELTGGRYTRAFLAADSKRDLKILDVTGRESPAERLSRGTREQLYLAFRLAVIEDFGEVRLPLPIVLDDILVNFDPERQRRSLDVLGRLSRRHQVIAFTCHPTVRELFAAQGAHVAEVSAERQLSLVTG